MDEPQPELPPVEDRRRRRALGCGLALALVCVPLWVLVGTDRPGLSPRWLVAGGALWTLALTWSWAEGRLRLGLALSAGALALLFALEVALRFVSGDHLPSQEFLLYRYDEELGWRWREGITATVSSPGEYRETIQVGPRGFRDLGPEPEDRPRLLVLGDSFTANLGVPAPAVFTQRLQGSLRPPTAVVNLGIPGHGTTQQALLLEETLGTVAPRAVVLVLYARNDLDDALGRLDDEFNVRRPRAKPGGDGVEIVRASGSPAAPTLDQLCQVLELVSCTWRAVALRAGDTTDAAFRAGPPPEARYGRRPRGSDEREAVEVVAALLLRCQQRCRDAGARFGVVLAPTVWQVDDGAWAGLTQRLGTSDLDRDAPQMDLLPKLQSAGVPTLDLLDAFRDAPAGDPLYYPWDTHWTARGNALAADAIESWLVREGLLAP